MVTAIQAALLASVATYPRLCCDLSEVRFLGAAGLTALVTARKAA